MCIRIIQTPRHSTPTCLLLRMPQTRCPSIKFRVWVGAKLLIFFFFLLSREYKSLIHYEYITLIRRELHEPAVGWAVH